MDNVTFDPRYVSRVVSGAWEKDVGTLDAESDSSFTGTHGHATPVLYLSLSFVQWDTWLTAINEVYHAQKDLLDVQVKLVCRSLPASGASSSVSLPPPPKKRKKAKLIPTSGPPPPPPPIAFPAAVVGGHLVPYSNANRERDRYIIHDSVVQT
eukprot:124561-Prymnesium_polylepis.1